MADVQSSPVTEAPPTVPPSAPSNDYMNVTILHRGTPHTFPFSADATIANLADAVSTHLSIPHSNQKFMITPKLGLLKPPFSDSTLQLRTLRNKKILLLAPTPSELSSLSQPSPLARPTSRPSPIKPATPSRSRDWRKVQDEATYTFHTVLPLPYLPDPSRSLRFLERLRDDAGIKASMRKHKFSVGVLTEMNPAEHTTHESRTLGLNRNRGEAIELRLRTDAYDGYRDYKVIRKTLCHELAHNVFGEHDRNFWDLTRDIEREVDANDWRSGGHALTSEEFYNPDDAGVDAEYMDGGGWTGGEFVLGRAENGGTGTSQMGNAQGLSRREVMAKAAEERIKRQKDVGRGGGGEAA
ncbi:WLM [Lasallia pustulata]|uniref:WLM n=1 Tax=Lasallia pustulata TaxID=136370 RepID=A0A1W5CUL0_9LECA|nr:WLM [Lasallia pustulata]